MHSARYGHRRENMHFARILETGAQIVTVTGKSRVWARARAAQATCVCAAQAEGETAQNTENTKLIPTTGHMSENIAPRRETVHHHQQHHQQHHHEHHNLCLHVIVVPIRAQ